MHIAQLIEQRIDPFLRIATAGLDISDMAVKFLAFDPRKTGGGHRLSAYGEFAIPEGMIVKGEIQKEDDLVEIFSAWRRSEKRIARSTFFTVSLPEEKSFLRIIQLPKIKEEDIQQAIRWEIEANIPLAFEELIYDYEVIAPAGDAGQSDHLDVVITAFPKAIIDVYVRVLCRAGLSLAALELESQAVTRSVVPDLHAASARIIADIGRTRTSFIVCVGGIIVFTTTIELGGQLLEDNLAKAFQISEEEAQIIKVQIGLNKKERNGAVFDALLPAMAVLADELGRVVEYYHHITHMHAAPESIGSIMLVGGDASLLGIETYLASAINLPVCIADPFVGVIPKNKFSIPPIRKNEALAFATTIGLALRGIR